MTPRCPPPSEAPPASGKVFVLGVSGASGAPYAVRVLEQMLMSGATVHGVVSEYGQRLLFDELGVKKVELAQLCPNLVESAAAAEEFGRRFIAHPNKDVGAVIASGSFLHDGMAVVPCASTSLGAIASGAGSNLLTRAAMVTLKERRPLVICHREMPLNLIDIENMRTLALAGADLCSPNPGFYLHPTSVHDIVDFTAGKVLDLLRIDHELKIRWEG
jgi:4-hydroxy-3-polyprenylbenzoate decarboxylase